MSGRDPAAMLSPLLSEGLDWVTRLDADACTPEERAELARWRARSPEHDAAFREARALGQVVREVGRELLQERREAFAHAALRRRSVSRRAVITGAAAAAVAGVVVAERDQIGALFGPRPDYVTGVGERRTVRLGRGLTVDLDAQTRLVVATAEGERQLTLLGGRSAVDVDLTGRPGLSLAAGKGRIRAQSARFDVELDPRRTCVTCVQGALQVAYDGMTVPLGPGQQLVYTDTGVGRPSSVDPALATAWIKGQLIFRQTPLAQVVTQMNRYRAGKVVIANPALGRRPINGVFYVSRMSEALFQIEQVTGAHRVDLPGGIVVFA